MFFVVFLVQSENKTINPSGGTWKIGFVWFKSFENSIKQHEKLFYSISSYWSNRMLVRRFPLQFCLNRRNTFLERGSVRISLTRDTFHVYKFLMLRAINYFCPQCRVLYLQVDQFIYVLFTKKKKKRWATHDWKDECLVCQRKIVLIKDMSSKLPCFCIRYPMSKPMCHILPLKQGEGWLDLQVFFVDPLHDTGKNSEREVLDPEPKETESTINMETFPYERW